MSPSADALWSVFVAAALGLSILVIALGAAMVIAQRRFLALHQSYGQRLLAAQDEERAAVAREVHDDAVQRLAVLRHELAILETESDSLSDAQRRRLEGLEGEIGDLSVSLRQLAHRLHPATLDHGDLSLALEQLAEEMDRVYGVEVDLSCREAGEVREPERVLALFRIAQETLRNVAKHAGVRRARLEIRRTDHQVTMVVQDRGRGFEAGSGEHPSRNGGLGLHTIRERARLVGGTAAITSRPGEGTTVRVTVPLEEGYRA